MVSGSVTISCEKKFAGSALHHTIFVDGTEIGDLNIGATMTMGFAHTGGSADEWFLSDYLVVWMMNPSVTQMADAHFLYEARYNGAQLTVVDPQYSATAVHADHWLPLRPGTDAALAWARWTPTEWKFTFRQRVPPRRLALHVPHDGSDVVIRLLAPTDRPDV